MLRVNSELPDLYEDCTFGTVLVGNAGFLKFAKSYRVNYNLRLCLIILASWENESENMIK